MVGFQYIASERKMEDSVTLGTNVFGVFSSHLFEMLNFVIILRLRREVLWQLHMMIAVFRF